MRRVHFFRRTVGDRPRPRGGAAFLLLLALQAFVGPAASKAIAAERPPRVVVLPFFAERRSDITSARSLSDLVMNELKTREAVQTVGSSGPGAPARTTRGAKKKKAWPRRPSDAVLAQGKKALEQQRFAEAIASLNQAIDLELSNLETASFAKVREARVLLAVAFFRQGEEDDARRALFEVARLWPNWELPRGKYPPVFVRELERARDRLRAGKRGKLVVKAPRGAKVYLDGEDVGAAPVKLSEIPTGVHYVKIAHEGALHAEQIEIAAKATAEVKASFGAREPVAEGADGKRAPRSRRMLDDDFAKTLDAYLAGVDADAAVIGVLAPDEGGKFLLATAIYSRGQRLFGRFPPVTLDADLGMANVEAFKLADQITVAAQGFAKGVTLPFDLLGSPRAVAAAADEPPEEKKEEEAEVAEVGPDDEPRATNLDPPQNDRSGTAAAAELQRPTRPAVASKSGPQWWWWVAGGVGVAALAGGTVYVVNEVRKPVSGTVTAQW